MESLRLPEACCHSTLGSGVVRPFGSDVTCPFRHRRPLQAESTRIKIMRIHMRRQLVSKLMTNDELLLRNYFCLWRGIAARINELKIAKEYVDSDDERRRKGASDFYVCMYVCMYV